MNSQLFPFSDTSASSSASSNVSATASKNTSPSEDKGFSDSLRHAEEESKTTETQATNNRKQDKREPVEKASSSDQAEETKVQEKKTHSDAIEETNVSAVADADAERVVDETIVEPIVTEDGVVITAEELASLLERVAEKLQIIKQEGGTDALAALVSDILGEDNILPINPIVSHISQALFAPPVMAKNNQATSLKQVSPLTPLAQALSIQPESQKTANASLASSESLNSTSQKSLLTVPAAGATTATMTSTQSLDKPFNTILQQQLIPVEGDVATKENVLTRMSSTVADISATGLNASTSHALPKAQLAVPTPFQQAEWGQVMAEKVVWMNTQGLKEADIHLDPPELGPIQVKVSIVNDQAQVSFVVQQGSVREALDQNAMRLREMFEGEGINLTDVDVSDQSPQQGNEDSTPEGQSAALTNDGDMDVTETSIKSSITGYSLVNLYA